MNTRTAKRLRRLVLDLRKRRELDSACGGGFFIRNPIYAIRLRGNGGFQYGYEICGYGTVLGYCNDHRPHKTRDAAESCGRRYETGIPSWMIWKGRAA